MLKDVRVTKYSASVAAQYFFYGLWLSITDASLLKFPSGRALVFNDNRI